MVFRHPDILYGLLALLIPVLVHLFNFRRHKKVMFSNVSLLKQINEKNRKQRNLLHLLVMFLRMLVLAFIVLALADPVIPSADETISGRTDRILYIDNSQSMVMAGEEGMLLHQAKKDAARLLSVASHTDRFRIISNNNPYLQANWMSAEEALRKLDEIDLTPGPVLLSEVIRQLGEDKTDRTDFIMFSDMQRRTTDPENMAADTMVQYTFIPYTSTDPGNLVMDSIWFTDPVLIPGNATSCRIRLINTGASDSPKVPVSLYIDNQLKSVATTDVPAHGSAMVTLGYTPYQSGWHRGVITLDDYPYTFDDQLFFSFYVRRDIRILLIGDPEENLPFQWLYDSDSLFNATRTNAGKVPYSTLGQYDVIVLNNLPEYTSGLTDAVTDFMERGGQVLVVSEKEGAEASLIAGTGMARLQGTDDHPTRVSDIKKDDPLLKAGLLSVPDNADVPSVYGHRRYHSPAGSGTLTLISLLDGDPWLMRKPVGRGQLYLLTSRVAMPESNLITNRLFPVVLAGMATQAGSAPPVYHYLSHRQKISIPLSRMPDQWLTLSREGENPLSLTPQQHYDPGMFTFLTTGDELTAGNYRLGTPDSIYALVSFNANRIESDLTPCTRVEMDSLLSLIPGLNYRIITPDAQSMTALGKQSPPGVPIWKLFIIFALSGMLLEGLLLRFGKRDRKPAPWKGESNLN